MGIVGNVSGSESRDEIRHHCRTDGEGGQAVTAGVSHAGGARRWDGDPKWVIRVVDSSISVAVRWK